MAARCEGMSVVAHLTAEICPFANLVAQKNFYDDDKREGFSAMHLDDVNDISPELIDAWVKCIYSSKTAAKVAVMVAGFPCKGTGMGVFIVFVHGFFIICSSFFLLFAHGFVYYLRMFFFISYASRQARELIRRLYASQ